MGRWWSSCSSRRGPQQGRMRLEAERGELDADSKIRRNQKASRKDGSGRFGRFESQRAGELVGVGMDRS